MEFKEELLLVFKGVLARSECLGFFDRIGFFGVFGSGLSCAAIVMGEGWYILRPLFWPFYGVVDLRGGLVSSFSIPLSCVLLLCLIGTAAVWPGSAGLYWFFQLNSSILKVYHGESG